MASLKQIGIAYLIFSVACGIAFAAMFTMLPGTIVADITGTPPEPVDFWPSFWSVLPIALVFGFLLSPVCYGCSQSYVNR